MGIKIPPVDDEELMRAFEVELRETVDRLGGMSLFAAAIACEKTFGLENMTLRQRRDVNGVLASYGLALDFPDLGPLKAV